MKKRIIIVGILIALVIAAVIAVNKSYRNYQREWDRQAIAATQAREKETETATARRHAIEDELKRLQKYCLLAPKTANANCAISVNP